MKKAIAGVVFGIVSAVGFNTVSAGVVLTFEGLNNFEPVADYYDGGMGGLGTGPGPNDGITFSANGLAYIPGKQSGTITPFPGDPSPPTVLLDDNTSAPAGSPVSTIMDVSGGFSGALLFYYIAIGRMPEIKIYSGLDGTGTLLADKTFSTTGTELSNAVFSPAELITFSGTAQSVVFVGGSDQLGMDNITFVSVPEPAGWISLTTGLGCACLALKGVKSGKRFRANRRANPRP